MDQVLAIRDARLRNIYQLVAALYNDKVIGDSVIQAAVDEERAQLGLQRLPHLQTSSTGLFYVTSTREDGMAEQFCNRFCHDSRNVEIGSQ
jgi:hypothetical protein